MSTENQQRRVSAYGAKLSGHDSVNVGRALPIYHDSLFRPAFPIINWIEIPGHSLGTFDGEDVFGWGTHPDATVDCINVANMRRYDLRKIDVLMGPAYNWGNLWQIQASLEEKRIFRSNQFAAIRLFLERNIVRVTLDFESNFFIPDPLIHDVWIPLDLHQTSPREGVGGKAMLKSQLTDDVKNARRAKYGLPDDEPKGLTGKATEYLKDAVAHEAKEAAAAAKWVWETFFGG